MTNPSLFRTFAIGSYVHGFWLKEKNQKLQTPPVADLWQPETKSLNKSGKRGRYAKVSQNVPIACPGKNLLLHPTYIIIFTVYVESPYLHSGFAGKASRPDRESSHE
ncbi:MAG: hypothetical protein BWK74_04695 [Desulfobacteraceae bacterium A6]|nr:MAG: hypothetical protein BWK74_04695 [Desulfobacteraceae bacterium A6]